MRAAEEDSLLAGGEIGSDHASVEVRTPSRMSAGPATICRVSSAGRLRAVVTELSAKMFQVPLSKKPIEDLAE
jgi:hypothetical protein